MNIAEKSNDLTNSSEILTAVYEILAGLSSQNKNAEEAYLYQLKSVAHSNKTLPENHVNVGTAFCNLGITETNINKLAEAAISFDKALKIFKQNKDNYFIIGLADTYSGLAVLERKKKNFGKATSYHRMSINIGGNPAYHNPSLNKYYCRTADTYKTMEKQNSTSYFIDLAIAICKKINLPKA